MGKVPLRSRAAFGAQPGGASPAAKLPPATSATAVAAQAAVTAAQLFRDIRALHEGSALASSCDALIKSQVERLQLAKEQELRRRQFASRNRTCAAVRQRLAHLGLLQREAARWSGLLLALVVFAWAELASRPRAVLKVLEGFARDLLRLRCWELWRLGVVCCGYAREEEDCRAKAEDQEQRWELALDRLERTYLNLEIRKRKNVKSSMVNLAVQSGAVANLHFAAWASYVQRVRERRSEALKATRGPEACKRVETRLLLSRLLLHWKRMVDELRKVLSAARSCAEKLFAMQQGDSGNLLHAVFKYWSYEISFKGHMANLERRRSGQFEHFGPRIEKMQKQKMRSRMMDLAGPKRVLADMMVSANTLFYYWRQAVERRRLTAFAERFRRPSRRAEAAAVQRVAAAAGALGQAMSALADFLLHFCFSAWHILLADPRMQELRRLRGANRASEAELVSWRQALRAQELALAFCKLERLAAGVWQRLGGTALGCWRAAALRETCAELRQHLAAEPAELAARRQEVSAKQVEICQHQEAAAHAFLRLFHRWRQGFCRLVLAAWFTECDIAVQALRRDRRAALLAEQGRQLEVVERERLLKKSRAAGLALASWGQDLWLPAVFQAWIRARDESKTATQLQELKFNHALFEQGLAKDSEQRLLRVKLPVIAYVFSSDAKQSRFVPLVALYEWRKVAKAAVFSKKRKKKFKEAIMDQLEQAAARARQLALCACFATWRLQCRLLPLERERAAAERAAWARGVAERRLRVFSRLHARVALRCRRLDALTGAFLAWRCAAGASGVRRAGDQVCANVDAQVHAGRRALQAAKASTGSAVVTAVRAARNSEQTCRLVAALCFPAWRDHAQLERRRRNVVLCEEDNLLQADRLRRWAATKQLRWARWAATGRGRASQRLWQLKVLQGWHSVAEAQGRQRSTEWKEAVHFSTLEYLVKQSWDRQRHCFLEWQRVVASEAVYSLEERVRRLEADITLDPGENLAADDWPSSSSSDGHMEDDAFPDSSPRGLRASLLLGSLGPAAASRPGLRSGAAADPRPSSPESLGEALAAGRRLSWMMDTGSGPSSAAPGPLPAAAAVGAGEGGDPSLASFAARLQQFTFGVQRSPAQTRLPGQ